MAYIGNLQLLTVKYKNEKISSHSQFQTYPDLSWEYSLRLEIRPNTTSYVCWSMVMTEAHVPDEWEKERKVI